MMDSGHDGTSHCNRAMEVRDIRFPTSEQLDGSDAMNPDPDYSAAYVILRTNASDGLEGHALAFTIGRGNEVQARAIEALRAHVLDLDVEECVRTWVGSAVAWCMTRSYVGSARRRA